MAIPSPASVPSWEDLEGTLPADALEPDYVNGVARASPSWEDESVRLFGKDRKDVRLVLYRDKAYWCPYVGDRFFRVSVWTASRCCVVLPEN